MGDSCDCASNIISPYCSNCSSDEEWTEVHRSHDRIECAQQEQQLEKRTENSPELDQFIHSDTVEKEPNLEISVLEKPETKPQFSICEQHIETTSYSYDDYVNSRDDDFWPDYSEWSDYGDKYMSDSFPSLVPLTRQQSSDTGYLFDGRDFDDETIIKSRRATQKEDPNSCKGKTRRRKCHCTRCRENYKCAFDSTQTEVVYDSKADKVDVGVVDGRYVLHVPCRRNNWDSVRETLREAAVKTRADPRRPRWREVRNVEHFSFEPSNKTLPVPMERKSKVYSEKSLPFKSGVYYTMRLQARPDERFDENEDFSMYVQDVPKPNSIELGDDEHYCEFIPTFLSRRTKQAKDSHLCYPMVSNEAVTSELGRYSRSRDYSYGYHQSAQTYQNCWASQPIGNDRGRKTDGSSYQDWFLEVDLKTECKVRALVIQGRAPVLRSFPSSSHLGLRYYQYKGPFYPVIDLDRPDNQWVEKVEVLVRVTRGEWHSLGIHGANVDCLNEVRINLDLDFNIRYMRVRPLSKSQGGYHGDAPAMRCAVIAEKRRSNKSRSLSIPRQSCNMLSARDNYDASLVSYTLYTPDEKKLGVNPKASYVSGPAIRECGVHDSGYDWHVKKIDSAKFQKRKAFQAMIMEDDSFQEDTSSYTLDDEDEGNDIA